jgi:hypothetical protein
MSVSVRGHTDPHLHSPCPTCGYATGYKQWPTRCACNRGCSNEELERWPWKNDPAWQQEIRQDDHRIPSTSPSGPPLRIADRYATGRPRALRRVQPERTDCRTTG